MSSSKLALIASFLSLPVLLTSAGCGSGAANPGGPSGPVATPTPTPTPTPSPAATRPAPCLLTAPTVNCAERNVHPLEMAEVLQAAIENAQNTPTVMYTDVSNRIYNLPLFRSKIVDYLTANGICGAWDYGNEIGDEIYLRSADGCVTEQYDLIAGDGGVRAANKTSNKWQEGWEVAPPPPKPDWPRVGDLNCSLPGDRSTFCISIKNSHGQFGEDVYRLFVQVFNENPALFDPNDYQPSQGDFIPDSLRVPAWRILDPDAYIAAVQRKLRSNGYCAFVDKGDILMVKSLTLGNLFHEEMDIIQNPPAGGAYAGFTIKDRCHDAGF